jgi:hypothetical protein
MQRNTPCTLSKCCNIVLVTAKSANVLMNPEECVTLIMEAKIEWPGFGSGRIVK